MAFDNETQPAVATEKRRTMVPKFGNLAGEVLVHPANPERTTDKIEVKGMAEKHRNAGGKIIYEVGFGGLFAVNLSPYDLSVGVDPMFSHKTNTKDLENGQYSERLFFNQPVSELPEGVFPDMVVMVAPSPETIGVILEELESKVDKNTKFAFFIENQSRQAVDGRAAEMTEEIGEMLRKFDKKVSVETEAAGLENDFDGYLQSMGIRAGGVLKTTPWEGSGDWMVVTAV